MRALIYSMGTDELRVWEFDLRNVASKFFPKRRRAVILSLEERLGSGAAQPRQPAENSPSVEVLDATLRQALTALSERHIFQWATFYREALSDAFRAFSGALETTTPPVPSCNSYGVRERLFRSLSF